jgi:2-(1,2-epoxy-1,2-dihydrophenyl)acetyl-CoA isomerase
MTDAPGVQKSMEGAVAVVRLNRPTRRNAIDLDTCRALTHLVLDAADDRAVRAMVLTGAERDFCTGADAVGSNEVIETTSPLDYRFKTADFNRLFLALWETELPVVSAVNGTVAGAGWLLALLADLVVAAEGARWTHVFVRRGMVPHAGDPYFLPRVIPLHRLNEIALLGDPVTSEMLGQWGIVNRVVPAHDVLATAMEIAHRLAAGPTRSIGLTKRLYRRSLDSDVVTAFEEERSALALISTTTDRLEGVSSFIEGRPPEFTGE